MARRDAARRATRAIALMEKAAYAYGLLAAAAALTWIGPAMIGWLHRLNLTGSHLATAPISASRLLGVMGLALLPVLLTLSVVTGAWAEE